jgi:hypothetical protein
LLDTILGNHPEIEGFGELSKLVSVGLRDNDYCACGARTADCPFWKEVRDVWHSRAGRDPGRYGELQQRVERLTSVGAGRSRKCRLLLDEYGEMSLALFEALAAVSGKSVLVDSSKLPTRALALARIPGLDLRLVHLVRDPKGVAWSMSKRLRADPQAGLRRDAESMRYWQASLHWTRTNLLAEGVRAGAGSPAVRLRYEDLVQRPADALVGVEPVAGCSLSELGSRIERGEPLVNHHAVAGNRLRMQAQVTLRRDEEWRAMPSHRRAVVDALAAPLLGRYGYSPSFGRRA